MKIPGYLKKERDISLTKEDLLRFEEEIKEIVDRLYEITSCEP